MKNEIIEVSAKALIRITSAWLAIIYTICSYTSFVAIIIYPTCTNPIPSNSPGNPDAVSLSYQAALQVGWAGTSHNDHHSRTVTGACSTAP